MYYVAGDGIFEGRYCRRADAERRKQELETYPVLWHDTPEIGEEPMILDQIIGRSGESTLRRWQDHGWTGRRK